MRVLVQHAGRQWGPYSLEEVQRALADGRFQPTDLAWHEGLSSWKPLSSIISASAAPSAPFKTARPTSGLAIASLALGACSPIFCILTGIPAIILGHLARTEIRRSEGKLNGDGMAVAGLVLGYASVVLLIFAAMFFLLFAGALGVPYSQAARTIHVSSERQYPTNAAGRVFRACRAFATDNGGRFPETLEELVPFYLENRELLVCPLTPQEEVGYLYFGGTDTDPGSELLLMSKGKDQKGRRLLVDKTGAVRFQRHEVAHAGPIAHEGLGTSGVAVRIGSAR